MGKSSQEFQLGRFIGIVLLISAFYLLLRLTSCIN